MGEIPRQRSVTPEGASSTPALPPRNTARLSRSPPQLQATEAPTLTTHIELTVDADNHGASEGDATADDEPETSQSEPEPSDSGLRKWNGIDRPLNARDILLRPLSVHFAPEVKPDYPLFLPADSERLWYLGFLKPWGTFNKSAINVFELVNWREAFDEVTDDLFAPPPPFDMTIETEYVEPQVLQKRFQQDVIDCVLMICNDQLSETRAMKDVQWMHVITTDASEEDLGNAEMIWKPSFVIKMENEQGLEDLRLLGHVEFLGGRKGALSWAIQEAAKNSWGSLRCVLGNIAQYMLFSSTSYAFIVSADEIMFLKMNIKEKVECPDPDGEPVDVFFEPWLRYSKPIKFTDLYKADEKSLSVKVGFICMLHLCMGPEFELPEFMGTSLNYAARTKPGEGYVPKLKPLDFSF